MRFQKLQKIGFCVKENCQFCDSHLIFRAITFIRNINLKEETNNQTIINEVHMDYLIRGC